LYPFLPADYKALQQRLKNLEARRGQVTGGIGSSAEPVSEIYRDSNLDIIQDESTRWMSESERLNYVFSRATAVEPTCQTDIVAIGSRVVFRNLTQGLDDEVLIGSYYQLARRGSEESDIDVASYASPLARALLGHCVGDTVQVVRGTGRKKQSLKVRITKISLLSE